MPARAPRPVSAATPRAAPSGRTWRPSASRRSSSGRWRTRIARWRSSRGRSAAHRSVWRGCSSGGTFRAARDADRPASPDPGPSPAISLVDLGVEVMIPNQSVGLSDVTQAPGDTGPADVELRLLVPHDDTPDPELSIVIPALNE